VSWGASRVLPLARVVHRLIDVHRYDRLSIDGTVEQPLGKVKRADWLNHWSEMNGG
jgi:hypothetical protein